MKTKNKIKTIISLTLIFFLINTIIIINYEKISCIILNGTENKKEDSSFIKNDESKSLAFEKEGNLGNLLGVKYKYNTPIDPLYVKAINLASYNNDEEPSITFINTTSFSINLDSLLNKNITTHISNNGSPVVLIIHTHGTESFVPNDKNYYFNDSKFNSTDITKNIVSVGESFCKVLEENNIPYIHDKTMYDENSYKLAYKNSGIAVKEYLEKYPSIKYVIDIHRDTISDSNNIYQKPLTTINNKDAAQIMFVVGTDAGGANHPKWNDNLSVVLRYQEIINRKYPTLARPIYIHTSSFNQYYLPTMMLLEIGASGNTLEEAKYSAELSADCLIELINQD